MLTSLCLVQSIKRNLREPYGTPQGAAQLATVARELAPFPIIALGGIDLNNVKACSEAGAGGFAASVSTAIGKLCPTL